MYMIHPVPPVHQFLEIITPGINTVRGVKLDAKLRQMLQNQTPSLLVIDEISLSAVIDGDLYGRRSCLKESVKKEIACS